MLHYLLKLPEKRHINAIILAIKLELNPKAPSLQIISNKHFHVHALHVKKRCQGCTLRIKKRPRGALTTRQHVTSQE